MLTNSRLYRADHDQAAGRRAEGFTLLEMIITIIIAMILMTIGIPSFFDMIQNNRMTSENNKLISGLLLARSEAVKRQYEVVLCPSADDTGCTGDWTDNNWIVFVDDDADGTTEPSDGNGALDSGEPLLRYEASAGSTLGWSVVTGDASIIFGANGMADGAHTLRLLDSRGEDSCVETLSSGRPVSVDCPNP
ncbi:MAG: GspH/FimT family protein [Candidatus Sedimenticola sp. (ex Thyasira tokunagai)]